MRHMTMKQNAGSPGLLHVCVLQGARACGVAWEVWGYFPAALHFVRRKCQRKGAGGVLWSAAGGANWLVATYCPSLGPCPSIGAGAHRPLTTLCPPSPSLACRSLCTSLSFPLVGRAKDGGGGGRAQHTNYWAPRTRKRHQQEHRPQRPTESSDPTHHAKGRTGDSPGPRKGATTRRNVTQGGSPPPPRSLRGARPRGVGRAQWNAPLSLTFCMRHLPIVPASQATLFAHLLPYPSACPSDAHADVHPRPACAFRPPPVHVLLPSACPAPHATHEPHF